MSEALKEARIDYGNTKRFHGATESSERPSFAGKRDLHAHLSLYRERVEYDGNPVKIERVEISSHIFASFVGSWVFYSVLGFQKISEEIPGKFVEISGKLSNQDSLREMSERRCLRKNENSNLGEILPEVIQIFLTILSIPRSLW
ncbi:hypothetical protein K0M31_007350 [Melipona bicolor]|uniref:Uncharacterized protein n=1 Tax=Melipona bicolor TaxID=60889 RepID=A0AA40GBI2_9HYME|nr:hypothetical protein K0M31_007350 [Melipona bicolor]